MPRTRTLRIRLNPDELAVLERLADRAFLPVSTFARAVMLKHLRDQGDTTDGAE